MAYPTRTLNAISGTGTGNQWTAGGATVGDDQSVSGYGASSVTGASKILSVPIANETDTTARSAEISQINVIVRIKSDTAIGHYIAIRTHRTWYYSTVKSIGRIS